MAPARPFTLAVLNQKGGTGKTTLAVNLASATHLGGKRTLILDLDKQGTALDWSAERPEGSKLEGLAVSKHDKAVTLDGLRSLSRGQDVVVLDGPPSLGGVLRSAAIVADAIVIPCQPSGFDFWALVDTMRLLQEADDMRLAAGLKPSKRFFLVWRANPRATLAAAFPETLRKEFGEQGSLMPIVVGDREAYRVASTRHESVLTLDPTGKAAGEIRSIIDYLRSEACPV